MSVYTILLILLFFIAHNLALEELNTPIPKSDCPLIDDVNHAVMLPYALDCSKYFSCVKGMAYLQQCPNNLHWSTLTYRCDYPDKAKCETSVSSGPPTNAIIQAPANALAASRTSELVYQSHPNDCSKYFKCQVLVCPANYYWNSDTQNCDFPHRAQCPFLKAANDLSRLPPKSLQIQPYQKDTFSLRYPNDCSKFYECQAMLCPINYHWNSRLQQCDLAQNVQCYSPPDKGEILETTTAAIPTAFTAPSTTATVTTPIVENVTAWCLDCVQTCDGYFHHYLPHPYDCHKFIQCNGWSFIHTCPDNLFWNAKLNTCDRVCVTI